MTISIAECKVLFRELSSEGCDMADVKQLGLNTEVKMREWIETNNSIREINLTVELWT